MYADIFQYKTLVLLLLLLITLSLTAARPDYFRQRPNTPSICSQPPPHSDIKCGFEYEGYYYDLKTNDCEKYVASGCHTEPGQTFGSRQVCLSICAYGTKQIQDLHHTE